jgi:hypothetical protein
MKGHFDDLIMLMEKWAWVGVCSHESPHKDGNFLCQVPPLEFDAQLNAFVIDINVPKLVCVPKHQH